MLKGGQQLRKGREITWSSQECDEGFGCYGRLDEMQQKRANTEMKEKRGKSKGARRNRAGCKKKKGKKDQHASPSFKPRAPTAQQSPGSSKAVKAENKAERQPRMQSRSTREPERNVRMIPLRWLMTMMMWELRKRTILELAIIFFTVFSLF